MNVLQLRDVLSTLLMDGYFLQEDSVEEPYIGLNDVQNYIALEDGSIFMLEGNGLVGSYVLPNGEEIPAIYVVGKKRVPSEWKVKGLEVAIQEAPAPNPTAMVGKVKNAKVWTVILVDYNTSSTNLAEAAERLSRRFPDARLSYRRGNELVYGQYVARIPDTELLNIYPPS